MKNKWMFALGLMLFVLFALAGAWVIVIQSSFGRNFMISMLTRELQSSGWQLTVGESEGALPNQLHLHDISISSPRGDIVTIQTLQVNLSLIHLLKKEIYFSKFQAEQIHWTPGTQILPSSATSGFPFALSIPELELKDIFLPTGEEIDLSGKVRVGRYNRWASLNLTAQSRSTEKSADMQLNFDRTKETSLHLNFAAHKNDFHLSAHGPWNAFSDVVFHETTATEPIHGTLRAHFQVDQPPVQGRWSLFSQIERVSSGDIRFSQLIAHDDLMKVKGHLTLNGQGQLKESDLQAIGKNINWSGVEGPFTARLQMESPDTTTLTISSPHLQWDRWTAQEINAVLHAKKDNEIWSGHLDFNAQLFGQKWDGKTDLLYQDLLTLDHLDIRSSIGSLEGHLQLPNFIGDLHLQAANMHDFDLPTYGALDATLRLKPQAMEIDAKAKNIFYGDAQAEDAFLYADLTGSFQDFSGTLYAEMQNVYWDKLSIDSASLEASSRDHQWPIVFHADGDWKGAFDLIAHANWHDSTIDLEDLQGFLFDHPLTLTQPTQLTWGPNRLQLGDLKLDIGDAHLMAMLNHEQEKTDATLALDRFPLDFLSVNPLSLSVMGFVNLNAEMHEKGPDITGSMNAQIINAEIKAENDPNPLTAQGILTAQLNNHRLNVKADMEARNAPLLHLSADWPIAIQTWPLQAHLLPEESVSASLTMKGRIEELLDFLDIGAHRWEGQCECDLKLSNNLQNPHITGSCRLVEGRYESYYSGLELQNINIDIEGKGSALQLLSLTAKDNQKGQLQIKGDLQLQDKLPYHATGDFSHLTIAETNWITTEANGTIEIIGNLDSAHMNIQSALVESHLTIPEQIPHSLPDLQVKYINAPKPIAAPLPSKSYPIFLDCHVFAPNGVFVTGRGLSSEWKGDVNLGGTYTDVEAKGRLDLLTGEFLFSGHALKLTEGSLTFNGRPHEMPILSLNAQIGLPNLTITAHLAGPLNQPQLAFQSIPALPMGSIISQLLFGQDLSEMNAIQAVQIVNSIASFSGGGAPSVFESTRRRLGVDRLRIVATPLGDEGGQTVALQVGKYVTRGVLVSVTQGAEGTSTNLMVEVDLTNGFIFQAESQQQLEQGKFTIKWNLNY